MLLRLHTIAAGPASPTRRADVPLRHWTTLADRRPGSESRLCRGFPPFPPFPGRMRCRHWLSSTPACSSQVLRKLGAPFTTAARPWIPMLHRPTRLPALPGERNGRRRQSGALLGIKADVGRLCWVWASIVAFIRLVVIKQADFGVRTHQFRLALRDTSTLQFAVCVPVALHAGLLDSLLPSLVTTMDPAQILAEDLMALSWRGSCSSDAVWPSYYYVICLDPLPDSKGLLPRCDGGRTAPESLANYQ